MGREGRGAELIGVRIWIRLGKGMGDVACIGAKVEDVWKMAFYILSGDVSKMEDEDMGCRAYEQSST